MIVFSWRSTVDSLVAMYRSLDTSATNNKFGGHFPWVWACILTVGHSRFTKCLG